MPFCRFLFNIVICVVNWYQRSRLFLALLFFVWVFFECVLLGFVFDCRDQMCELWVISQWQQNSFKCTKWPISFKRFGKGFSSSFSAFLLCGRFFRPSVFGLFFSFFFFLCCWKVTTAMCVTSEVLKVRCRLCTRSLIQNSFLFSKWGTISACDDKIFLILYFFVIIWYHSFSSSSSRHLTKYFELINKWETKYDFSPIEKWFHENWW